MPVKKPPKIDLFNVRPDTIICLFLVTTTLAVYWQVRNFSFLIYDDSLYVTSNLQVQAGLNLKNIYWAFSSFDASNWHPLTWLSHMLDVQLYGMNPGAHHMTNVLFHILNTSLLFLTFKRMTGKIWQSGMVAALFALHPLHVESVAWIAERKDVLSTFFWMLTLCGYVWYAEKPGLKRYLSVLSFFLLGLMAKPMLVTLPFVLLLLDFWPLKRFRFNSIWGDKVESSQCYAALKMIYEKTPFFVLSTVSSIVTFLVQQKGGAVASLESLPIADRFAVALLSYVKYIAKMIWPSNLSVFYPQPEIVPGWQVTGAGIFLLVTSLLAIWSRKKRPWFTVGWLWYIGTLVPVIGLVQVGLQAMADRYTYVPIIGLFVILVGGISELTAKWHYKRVGYAVSAAIILSALIVVSWFQVSHWANSITLFKHALNVTNNNFLAHNALGNALVMRGKSSEAILHYTEALRLKPNYSSAHYNMAHALAVQQDHQAAIKHLRQAILINPEYAEAHNYLGHELEKQGKKREAIEHFRRALQINSDYAIASLNLDRLVSIP